MSRKLQNNFSTRNNATSTTRPVTEKKTVPFVKMSRTGYGHGTPSRTTKLEKRCAVITYFWFEQSFLAHAANQLYFFQPLFPCWKRSCWNDCHAEKKEPKTLQLTKLISFSCDKSKKVYKHFLKVHKSVYTKTHLISITFLWSTRPSRDLNSRLTSQPRRHRRKRHLPRARFLKN